MTAIQFASGLSQLPFSSANVTVTSGGSTTVPRTLYIAIQGENPAGVNLLSAIAGPFTVGAGQQLQVTIPSTVRTDSDGWLDYVISASTNNTPTTFVQLAKVAAKDVSGVVVALPTTLTLSTDEHFKLSTSAANPTALPTSLVNGMLRGVLAKDDGTPLNLLYEYDATSTATANGTSVLLASTGRWHLKPGTFSTYVAATTDPGGCDQEIDGINEAVVRTAKYACNGTNGKAIRFWLKNDATANIPSGKRIGLTVSFNEQPQTALFEGLLWISFLGYANTSTGAVRTTYADSTSFSGVGFPVIFENKKTDLILQDDLAPGEAVALEIYPNFRPEQLRGRILNRAIAKIEFGFYEQAGAYQESWFITGDWIYNEFDRGAVLPSTGVAVVVGKRSGLVARQSFLAQPKTEVLGLSNNTGNQQIRINGNGAVYKGTGTQLPTEALRAIVSTEAGISTASSWSAPVTLSGSQGLRVTLTYPSNGTTATIRSNYRDRLTASNAQATFNPTKVVIYIRSGSTIKQFSGFTVVNGATQTFDLSDWSLGTVIGSVPTATDDFCLFEAVSATGTANGSGNFPNGVEVAFAYDYDGSAVTKISHDKAAGCLQTSALSLADLEEAAKYWASPAWDLVALREIPASQRYDGQSRMVIGLRKPYIWNSGSAIADDGTATSVSAQPDDVTGFGRWLIDDSSNFYHSSQFSPSGGIPSNSFGDARDYCIDDVEASPTFGTLFYKSGDTWTSLCVLRGPTGPKGLSFILLNQDPIASQGTDGDAAFNSVTRDLFYKSGGGWTFDRNLRDANFKGNWNSVTQYKDPDVVLYNRNLWKAIATNTNVPPSEGASWTLFLPGGQDGIDGEDGIAATIAIGTVTTLGSSNPATVTNSGTSNAAVLNFGIPQGATGPAGSVTSSTGALTFDNNATPPTTTASQTAIYSDATGILKWIPVSSGAAKLFAFLDLAQVWSEIQSFVATKFKHTTAPSTASDELALFATSSGFKYREQSDGAARSLAVLEKPQDFTKSQAVAPVSVPYTSTVTLDCSLSNTFIIGTLIGNITVNISNLRAGQAIAIRFTQDAAGGKTVTWQSEKFQWAGGSAGILSTTGNAVDDFFGLSFDGTKITGNLLPGVA